jgi:hypothetical protein
MVIRLSFGSEKTQFCYNQTGENLLKLLIFREGKQIIRNREKKPLPHLCPILVLFVTKYLKTKLPEERKC